MRSDIALHLSVRTALSRVLGPPAQRICVIVANGVVTVSGDVDSIDERTRVASAIRELPDVQALAIGIQVAAQAPLPSETV